MQVNRITICYSVGSYKRSWEKIRDKWQDVKSKALSKNTQNLNKTGNAPQEILSKWEKLIIDFLQTRNSDLITGLEGGFDTSEVQIFLFT